MKILLILLAFFTTSTLACVGTNPTQLSALQDLYSSTSGKYWHFASGTNNWIVGTDYCSWNGVMCDANCNYVTSLMLPSANMKGTLPSSLGNLIGLQTLDLSGNGYLNGTLPTNILTSFSQLETLKIDMTSIGGYINGVNGGCTPYLQNLAIGESRFLLGYDFSQCKGLRSISLNQGFFHYNFPISSSTSLSTCNFPSLITADFSNAFVTNYFSLSCFCQSPLLETLLAGSAGLVGGAVPQCLSALPNLQYLVIGGNNFTSFGTYNGYKALQVVEMTYNSISVDLSTLYFPSLIKGIFSQNKIYGAPFLNISPVLEILFIDDNNISGDFPNPTIYPPFLQLVDARLNPQLVYKNGYFRPTSTIYTTDLSTSPPFSSSVLCNALRSYDINRQYQATIYVSPTYYIGTSLYASYCMTIQ